MDRLSANNIREQNGGKNNNEIRKFVKKTFRLRFIVFRISGLLKQIVTSSSGTYNIQTSIHYVCFYQNFLFGDRTFVLTPLTFTKAKNYVSSARFSFAPNTIRTLVVYLITFSLNNIRVFLPPKMQRVLR